MSSNFPSSQDSFDSNTDGVDTVLAADMNNVQDAIEAIEAELGNDPAGQYTDVNTRLDNNLTEAENAVTTSASGNITLTDASGVVQYIDCNGADRIVTLPAEASSNHPFKIINTTGANYKITIQDDGAGAVAVVLDGKGVEVISNGVAWKPIGKNITSQFALTAGGGKPTTTAGCADAAKTELGTNDVDIVTLNFDKDTDEYAVWQFPLPDDYDGGTISYRVYWSHAAATAYVVYFQLAGLAVGDDDAQDASWGTQVSVNDTGGTTNDIYITAWSSAVTIAGTPVAGDYVFLRLNRDANNGSDTLDVDARVQAVQILYTRQ